MSPKTPGEATAPDETIALEANRKAELAKDPQTLQTTPGSIDEAVSIIQAEKDGLVKNPRRPDLSKGEPNLDFVIDGGYADIKTPIEPTYQSIAEQAGSIAKKIKMYDSDVKIVIELKNLSTLNKALFKSEIIKTGAPPDNVIYLNSD